MTHKLHVQETVKLKMNHLLINNLFTYTTVTYNQYVKIYFHLNFYGNRNLGCLKKEVTEDFGGPNPSAFQNQSSKVNGFSDSPLP